MGLTELDRRGLRLLDEGELVFMAGGLWSRPGDTSCFTDEERAVGTSTINRLVRAGLAEYENGWTVARVVEEDGDAG